MPGTFPPPPQVRDPDMHLGTCVTQVPWCMPGSLTWVFLWSWWRGKRSRHSRRMRNPRFYVSGKRCMIVYLGYFSLAPFHRYEIIYNEHIVVPQPHAAYEFCLYRTSISVAKHGSIAYLSIFNIIGHISSFESFKQSGDSWAFETPQIPVSIVAS